MTEPSFAVAENLIFGRLAFNGANPEIEKMMENREAITQAFQNLDDIFGAILGRFFERQYYRDRLKGGP